MDVSITKTSTRGSDRCVRCGSELRIEERLLVGEVVHCESCQAPLEVVDPDPLVVEPVAKIEEEEEDFNFGP